MSQSQNRSSKIKSPDLLNIEDIVSDIRNVANANNVKPEELDLTKYAKLGGKFDGRALRRLGGYNAIHAEAFAEETAEDIVTSRYLKRRRDYVSKLEREVADVSVWSHNLISSFEDLFKKMSPVQVSNVTKPAYKLTLSQNRANGVLISDIHLGLKISGQEVMTNQYDWNIASRRLGKLAEQVAKYKVDHRQECKELHVCLGGDLGQGVIHLTDSNTDLITYQIWGIVSYLTQMIDYWRGHYPRIVVHCTPDNHLRLPHKGPDRALAQKFDAFSAFIHMGLQLAFRDAPDVVFDVPKTAITTFYVLGHKFGLTHGDTHVNSGNVGQSVNVKSIVNQILRLNAAQLDGKNYDAFLLGHVHVPLFMHLNETRTQLIINGTGSGTDPYAESMGFFNTRPTQVIWESTDQYPVGDFRIVDLGDADGDSRFNDFIKPYDYELDFHAVK